MRGLTSQTCRAGDKTIKIWSLNDYTCVKTLEGHTAGVLKVCDRNLHAYRWPSYRMGLNSNIWPV